MPVKETTVEIKLKNLKNNLEYLKSKITSKTKFMAVVKAFSYGSDSRVVSQELERLGVNYLAVAYTQEGVDLRKFGIKIPILILHPQEKDFDNIIENQLEPSIYSFRILSFFIKALKKKNKTSYPYHIKFNTGLNRIGFLKKDIHKLSKQIKSNLPKYLFSHLGASEDLNEKKYTKKQIEEFISIDKALEIELGTPLKKHLLNTSGILNYSDYQFDMVRSGIGLYGFGNDIKFEKNLKPVLTLKTIISQIHEIKKGESVGYNKGFVAKTNSVIATLPIGHADGIGRQYGNEKGEVLIENKMAKIVGNVCMDMLMIDVTNIKCEEGDEVVFFDDKSYSAEEFSKKANTISYELISSISRRIKRVVSR